MVTDVRKRIIRKKMKRGDIAKVSKQLGIPYDTVYSVIQCTRAGGKHDIIWASVERLVNTRIRKERADARKLKSMAA